MLKALMLGSALSAVALRQVENEDGTPEPEGYDWDAIREAFKEEKGRDIKVSDKVLDMASSNAPQWDQWNADGDSVAIFAFIEKVEEAANRVGISDPGITALVGKIDDMFDAEVSECLDALVKSKTTAVDIYAQLRRVYTKDELNAMPFAGSDEKSVEGTNYRADKVKTKDRVTGIEMTTTWLNDFVAATSWGKAFENELAEVSKELKTAGTTSLAKYKGKGKKFLRNASATLTQKRNGLRSMFKRAINTHHQLEAVEGMPLVVIEWMNGGKDGIRIPNEFGSGKLDEKDSFTVSKSPKPFWIYPKGQAGEGRDISVTQLTNFDVTAALNAENGGTMGDLIDTLSKGSDAPDATGDGSQMPEEEALTTQQRWNNYLSNKENRANIRRLLSDKKNPDRKELLENIMSEFHLILPLVRLYKDEYEAMTGGEKAPQEVTGKAA